MKRLIPLLCFVLPVALLAGCASTPDPMALVRHAEQASGAAAVKTITFSGRGSGSAFGQAWQATSPWPGLSYSVLTRQVDYERAAMREDYARSRSEPNGGGATPLMGQGEARVAAFVAGGHAWNLTGSTVSASPVALPARVHEIWTTPHGVIKAALRHGARDAGADAAGNRRVAFEVPGALSAVLTLDARGLPLRVDSRLPHPVAGDTEMSASFDDWREVPGAPAGVRFPMHIRQRQGGWEVLNLAVQSVQLNPALSIEAPETVRAFRERVVSEKLAEGVWFLGGGSHHSVLVEMSNHLVLIEAPLYDGRTEAVLAEVARLVPNKPVRTVINSHHHFDHAGGLRAAAAAGASLVVSEAARSLFEKLFANPNRIAPDALQRSGRSVNFIPVSGGRLALNDGGSPGARRIEIHEIQGSVHAQGFHLIYLPAERLLVQADAYTPLPAGSPPPPVVNDNHRNLVANIERLGLSVDRIVPLHGRVVPMSELLAMIGRRP